MNDVPRTSQFDFGWTPDRVDQLRLMVAGGLSAGRIAEKFGGLLTRSAVIGKCHRLGLQLTGTKARRPIQAVETVVPTAYRAPRLAKPVATSQSAPKPMPRTVAAPVVEIDQMFTPRDPVHLLDARRDQCRFEVDRDNDGMICCGAEVVKPGMSWCRCHLARVLTKEGLERFTKQQSKRVAT